MKKLLVVSIFAYFHISTFAYCAPAPYGRFEDGMLSKTRPAGWLEGTCRVQSEGLTGHPEALSYPYDTCLWAGSIPRMGTHGSDWWRYEQTAYYTDGLLRLGYALGDKPFIEKGEAGVGYTLDNVSPDGYLGNACLWDAKNFKLKKGYDMWPFAVFFRAMKAKYDAAPDERIPAALARYFLLFDKKHVSEFRNVVNVEGMLWAYSHTGDKRLLELAEEAWRMRKPLPPNKKNELAPENCANDDAIHMHGVSYCEEMKVPMILAAYTGKKEYLDQAVNVERKLVRDHMLPDGCPSSTERVRGNSVHWGHETCDVADYTWSLGYFLETTGDASYADKIERCAFNAGFGAVSDDFRALQYFSNPNQFICTSNSDNNPHNYGTTWMQYRPTHETECCAGNVHRIVPNYISRMWLKDAKGRPVAALYGPSEVDYGWAKIKEETRYPFDGKITFRFSVKEPTDSAFTYRVPSWCKGGASVTVNGERGTSAAPGKFETIERKFKDGDVIELDFPMEVRFEELPRRFVVDNKDVKRGVKRPAEKFANASQGTVVTRGPLLFAYPIPTERTEDTEEHANMNGKKSANPDFKCWNMRPAGSFNYALAAHEAEVVQQSDAVGDGFFKNPGAIKLRVKVRRIEWTLDENRFTPDIPENPVVLDGAEETIELVPYGATMLRLGVFPDVTSKPHLYMAGDSIMADYKPGEWPQYGWGQALKAFMKEPSHIHNFARSGWSARRFRESGRWEDCIASKLKRGDWVIVSFGHNDSNKKRNKPPKNDYSTPEEYKAFLKGFAADALAKGANIAFATSIAHSDGFSETNGVMRVDGGARGLGPYVAAMREVAAELGLSLLDLNRYAEKNLPKMGMEAAKTLYMFVEPGEYANYPNGKRDAAHIRDKGAFFYAKGAVEMARKQGLPIADVWKDPADVPFVPSVAPVPPVQAMAAKASAPSGKGGESVKVMTYNIRYSAGDKNSADNNWEARRDDLANLVESANPDVAGFQEVLPDQRKWLEARFPGYAFVGDGRNADRVNGEASPIAFRKDRFEPVKSGTFWLSETPDEPGSKSWKAALPRICSYAVLKDRATGKTFAFANTHTDHRSEEAREKGMLLVIERMKEFSDGAPVVFVGDHNCLEYEKPAKSVAKLLKDALYISETPPEGPWRTFNFWSYKDKELSIKDALARPVRERSIPGDMSDAKRIDYIYVSPGTRVLGYRTIAATRPGTKLYPSDHFPSVAEVVFGASPATP